MNNFTQEFFNGNRQKLAEKLTNSVIVVAANGVLQASNDTEFKFRQDSNFWYLTGIDLPDLVLVIDSSRGVDTIFYPELTDYQKEWDGDLEIEAIKHSSGVTNVKSLDEFKNYLKNAKNNKLKICYTKPADEIIEPYGIYSNPARRKIANIVESVDSDPYDVRMDIARLRQIKQSVEIIEIQRAIDITSDSLNVIRSNVGSYNNEAEISKAISSSFYKFGADGLAFQSIVASGKNASIIHHRIPTKFDSSNDLVLLDIGAQSGYYAADISRTWSLNGKPTKRQIELHNCVLKIQDYAFSILKPGVYLREYQMQVENKAKKIFDSLNCQVGDRPFPHAISHFLGIDVHDPGDYDLQLQENMILTVEPGLYLKNEGTGIRIEDDVIVTKNSIENLSAKISNSL